MKIAILCKGNVSSIPPVINSIIELLKLNVHVHLICGNIEDQTVDYLLSIDKNIFIEKIQSSNNKFSKWYNFHRYAWARIKKIKFDLLWISTGDTALCLGYNIKKYKYILNILELYDSAPLYKKLLKRMAQNAHKVIVPEYNRACILRVWWNLKETPLVIPNKPQFLITEKDLEIENIIQEINSKKKDRKIILYQGLITPHRKLDILTEVSFKLKDKFFLVLMGPDFDYVDKLRKLNEDLLYIKSIPAPIHLNITEIADIGVVVYDFVDLNNIYCAPNKIWEYSKFGKPMLGSDIPGLKYTIETAGAGVCVDSQNKENIEETLNQLFNNYCEYSTNSQNFYKSADLEKTYRLILHSL